MESARALASVLARRNDSLKRATGNGQPNLGFYRPTEPCLQELTSTNKAASAPARALAEGKFLWLSYVIGRWTRQAYQTKKPMVLKQALGNRLFTDEE